MERRRGVRVAWLGLAGLLAGLLCARGAWSQPHLAQLPPVARFTAHDRLLVLAPHCDDETLATGGLIQQARAAGAAVQVVIVTNGDGFRTAAVPAGAPPKTRATPEEYLRLGRTRQRESLAGLAKLGVEARQVVFLGYPDGGLVRLWLEYWADPQRYPSTATQAREVPYPRSLRPGAPYNARAVLTDLETILRRFQPTVMALPHPGDRHSDHWTTYCFGTAALYEVGQLERVRTLHYLVHRRGWSEPPRSEETSVQAPPDQLDPWQALPLTADQQARQRAAFACYPSQLTVLRNFMQQFLGPVELFASVSPRPLPNAPQVVWVAAHGADPAPVIPAPPAGGGPATHFGPIWANLSEGKLTLLVQLSEAAAEGVSYRVYLHPLAKGRVGPPQGYVLDPRHPRAGVQVRVSGKRLEVKLPWRPEYAGALLAAEARVPGAPPDRTRWVLLRTRAA